MYTRIVIKMEKTPDLSLNFLKFLGIIKNAVVYFLFQSCEYQTEIYVFVFFSEFHLIYFPVLFT